MAKTVIDFHKELGKEELGQEYAVRQAVLLNGFEERAGVKLYNTEDDPEWVKRDMAFYRSAREICEAMYKMPMEVKRCLSADIFALHYLLTNGRLDALIVSLPQKPREPEKLEALRVKLAWRFLEKIRGLHQEREMVTSKYRVSLGLELEISSDGMSIKGVSAEEEKALTFPISSAQTTSKYGSHKVVNRPESSFTSAIEVVSAPSRSVPLQLLQLKYLLKPERLGGDATYHITFGGVDIIPEHTEVMDLQAMALACGWMERFSGSGRPFVENFQKASEIKGRFYYFPGFRRRDGNKLEYYGGREKGVEFRCNEKSSLTDEWYKNFAEHLTFENYGCVVIKAVQKDPAKRDGVEKILVEKWEEMMKNWEIMLGEHSLTSPKLSERYVEMVDGVDLRETTITYESFLGKISKAGFNDREFSKKARVIAEKFTEEIRGILDTAEKG